MPACSWARMPWQHAGLRSSAPGFRPPAVSSKEPAWQVAGAAAEALAPEAGEFASLDMVSYAWMVR
jgi:hypothetical protein